MRRGFCVAVYLTGLCFALPGVAAAQGVDTQDVVVQSSRTSGRADKSGEKVTVNVIYESVTSTPKAVLLVLPSTSGTNKDTNAPALNFNRYEPAYYPLSRNRDALLQSGLALAWMGWPSQSQFGKDGTASYEMQEDISSVIKNARLRWPAVPLILTGTFAGANTALTFALKRGESVNGMLALSPYWMRERGEKVESLKGLKALVIHDTSGECMVATGPEVGEISARAGFVRLPVNVGRVGQIGNCGDKSAQWLPQADSQLVPVIGQWLEGQAVPDHLGSDVAVVTTTERVVVVNGPSGKMEITLQTPPGKGPFPVFMFNHGDVDGEHAAIQYKERLRETLVGSAFLTWGFAVAVPARPGVGRSEGIYRYSQYAINDGDPTYKARHHSEAVLAAIEGLRGEKDLNLDQLLLAGQSAGGDTVMYMSTLAIPGLRGVLNFSGGRSNHAWNQSPKFENGMMIDGWTEMGKKAKVPVMLVFAENDSRYSPNTIRKSAQAFNDAGGKAELLLLPVQPEDGHFVYHRPLLWTSAVWRFVSGLRMGNASPFAPASPLAEPLALATEATHPDLFDLSRLPNKGKGCIDLYQQFLTKMLPRYFAVGSEGRGCGYSFGKDASEEKAVAACQKHVERCIPYAKDNELVKPALTAAATN